MRKITLALVVPNEATPAELAEKITAAAADAATAVAELDHVNGLYAPGVGDGDHWACRIDHVSLLG